MKFLSLIALFFATQISYAEGVSVPYIPEWRVYIFYSDCLPNQEKDAPEWLKVENCGEKPFRFDQWQECERSMPSLGADGSYGEAKACYRAMFSSDMDDQ